MFKKISNEVFLRSRPHVSVFVWKRRFFLRFGLLCTRIRWKLSLKTYLFKSALHSEEFWNCRLLVYEWTDENGGFRIRWCHSSLTTIITNALWGMLSYFHCLPFPYGRAKKIRISYVWMLFFSEKGGKNLRFQKYLDTCGRGLGVASLCISFHGQYPIVVKQKSIP